MNLRLSTLIIIRVMTAFVTIRSREDLQCLELEPIVVQHVGWFGMMKPKHPRDTYGGGAVGLARRLFITRMSKRVLGLAKFEHKKCSSGNRINNAGFKVVLIRCCLWSSEWSIDKQPPNPIREGTHASLCNF